MYYFKKVLCLVFFIFLYCIMINYRESASFELETGIPTFYIINWLWHFVVGVPLGAFFYNDFVLSINKVPKVIVSLLLFILSNGYGMLLLGLSTIVPYQLKVALYDLSPFFQIIFGMWLFLIIFDLLKRNKNKDSY